MIVILFADVPFAAWILFDSIHHNDHQRVSPSVSIIANGVAPTLLYHRPDGIVGSGRQVAALSDGVSTSSPATASSCSAEHDNIWSLPNGRVQFDCPLSFAGLSMQNGEIISDTTTSSVISLWDPKLLGRYVLL